MFAGSIRSGSLACGIAVLLLGIGGCGGCHPAAVVDPVRDASRDAKVGETPTGGTREKKIVYLEQNWTPAESLAFYYTSQGSQILPYNWFLNLEQAGTSKPFRDDENMLKYGYLVQDKGPMNPDGLPVGFVKDEGDRRAWVGFTCAACHTSQVDLDGVGYRIDGGPSLSDVREFLVGLTDALKATRDGDAKFAAFAAKVLPPSAGDKEKADLKADLTEIIGRRDGYNTRNFAPDIPPLPGRVDAFGAIMNEVFHEAVNQGAATPIGASAAPANAPVSYPFLWDTPQHDRVQWNGAVVNAGLGALGRNVGEVLGVFGRLNIPEHPDVTGYPSSVRVLNLLAIEKNITKLWSPKWPAAFPPINATLRDQGRAIYDRQKCASCHDSPGFDRTSPTRTIKAQLVAVDTDDRMFLNFTRRSSPTGKLKGTFVNFLPLPLPNPPTFGDMATGDLILGQVVRGTIVGSGWPAPADSLKTAEYQRPFASAAPGPVGRGGGIYKARQLNGIWATAPYLHNGSVPSLYTLFSPVEERPKSFRVGSREFDPVNVGFKTDAEGYPLFRARSDDGKPIPGNSNDGHTPDPPLNKDERLALVEYLKSL